MTLTSRSLSSLVFTALLALSLVATTQNALAKSTTTNALPSLPALLDNDFLPAFFDRDLADFAKKHLHRPLGRLGVSWE